MTLGVGNYTLRVTEGATIDVVGADSGVTVNGANVVAADVVASNGVIHVVDAVILPPASSASAD